MFETSEVVATASFADAATAIVAIGELRLTAIDLAEDVHTVVHVEAASADQLGVARLVEKTLTDGSKVYNIVLASA